MKTERPVYQRLFEISGLVGAHYFPFRPSFVPRWEQYPFAQLYVILDGYGVYKTENGEYPLRPGVMLYRPANKRSLYAWESEHVHYGLVNFACDSPAMEIFEGETIPLGEEEQAMLLDVIKTTTNICDRSKEKKPPHYDIIVKPDTPDVVLEFIYASLERFLSMLYCRVQSIPLAVNEEQKVNRLVDSSTLVTNVKMYLAEHVCEKLTVGDLCVHFGISKTVLMQKFHSTTNQTVIEYFNELKIAKAKTVIRKTSMSFTELSELLGFSSVHYFSKLFKAKTGMTPTAFSKHVSKRTASV
ncbi:MAG: AraC family transcriptional regulator [Clostridia bacterium]|nr:AraC family transcriptional regulator [Clostridia bacterium]